MPWRHSEAKLQLHLDIIEGLVTEDDNPGDVYNMWPELYHVYHINSFTRSLESLLKKHAEELDKQKRNKKPVEWKKSQAREQLELDIIAGVVTKESDPNEVYTMWPIYQDYNQDNFKKNLKAMLERHGAKNKRADFDAKAYVHDRKIRPFPMRDGQGCFQWHGSEAQKKLQAAITDGTYLHGQTKPKDLWESDDDYKLFPLTKFRDHIYQEIKGKKSRNYFKDKARKWTH